MYFLEDSLMIQAEPERIQIHVMELYPENYEFEGFPKYKRSPRIIKKTTKGHHRYSNTDGKVRYGKRKSGTNDLCRLC